MKSSSQGKRLETTERRRALTTPKTSARRKALKAPPVQPTKSTPGKTSRKRGRQLAERTTPLAAANSQLRKQLAESQRAQEALRQRERHVYGILESIQDGFFELDRAWRFTYVNPRAASNVGFAPEQLVGHSIWEKFPGILGTPHETHFRQAMAERVPLRYEMRGVLTSGTYEIRVYPSSEGISVYWIDITDRKRMEEALTESEQRANDLIRYAPTGIYEIDYTGPRFKQVNDAMCRISGYTREELLAMSPFALLDPLSQALFQTRIRQTLAGEPIDREVEYGVRTKDGRELYAVLNVTLTYEGGKATGAFVIAHDVTERRRTVEALRHAEQRYALAQQAAGIVSWERDLQTNAMTWSAEPAPLLGAGCSTFDELLERVHPEDREDFTQAADETLRSGKGEVEHRVMLPDGRLRWIRQTGGLIRDDQGRPMRMLGIVEDITPRREAESKYAAILQTVQSGFWLLDLEGRLLEVNAAYCRMSGYSQYELLHMSIADLEADETPEGIARHIRSIREHGHHQFESRHRRKDGTLFEVDLRVSWLNVGGGRMVTLIWDISERKKVERALREREARLHVLAEGMPQVVWSADVSGAMNYYNQWAYAYGGVEPGDIQGWKWSLVIHPDDLEPTVTAWQHSLQRGETYVIEQRLRRADGIFRWHLTRGVPVRDEQGRITRWIGTATDIEDQKRAQAVILQLNQDLEGANEELEVGNEELQTANDQLQATNRKLAEEIAKRKQAEEIQHLSEERYRRLVEVSPDGILLHRAGIVQFVNAGGARILGTGDPTQIVGRPFLDFVHPAERRAVQARMDAVADRLRPEPLVEEKLLRVDGTMIDAEFTARAYPEAQDAVLVVFRDVTERKRAEREWRENELLVHAIMDGIPDPVYIKDRTSRILLANRALSQVAGKPLAEIIGQTDSEYYGDPAVGQKLREHDLQVMASQTNAVFEESVRTPDGERTFLSTKAPYRNASGEIIGILGISRDITDRKQAEANIQKLNRDLERRAVELEMANSELEAFSYSVSHDLRTPLSAIDGFARLLAQEHGAELTPESQRYVGLIRENTTAMLRLIQDLLAFSRASRQPLQKQSVSPEATVRETLAELQGAYVGRQVQVDIRNLPPCQADPHLLKQVYVNLLSNAFKFTRSRDLATIEIGHGLCDGEEAYYVRDNGVGFDMSQADRLFGVFQRLHAEEEYEGTGVGLAIVERIIRRHGGRIWAEAEVDKGATFFFTLP